MIPLPLDLFANSIILVYWINCHAISTMTISTYTVYIYIDTDGACAADQSGIKDSAAVSVSPTVVLGI